MATGVQTGAEDGPVDTDEQGSGAMAESELAAADPVRVNGFSHAAMTETRPMF